MDLEFVYKICSKSEWSSAKKKGQFKGSEMDLKDGFIHFSTKFQLIGTLEKYYKSEKNLENFLNIFEKYKEILVSFTKWMREKINSNKDDASAACNDYLKVLGYTALALSLIHI